MKLIECLAGKANYWEFIGLGKTGYDCVDGIDAPSEEPSDTDEDGFDRQDRQQTDGDMQHPAKTAMPQEEEAEVGLQRWNDSPLITGTKLGLDEFVDKILLARRIAGKNPVLPSWLPHTRDDNNNTILHYAAEETVKAEEASVLQMQLEMQWFEKVEKMVPKDLQYCRNAEEKTAQELFTKKHEKMAESGKTQLTEFGKTCAGLVAAFVFASSFSIPESEGSGARIYHKAAFKVFMHAFVFGLSCSSTALVMFLWLVISSYKEQEFRRSLPTKFFFAALSFFLALVSLLVAFACNIFLQIYSGRRTGAKELIPFVCELTLFPGITVIVLFYRGSTFSIFSLARQIWR